MDRKVKRLATLVGCNYFNTRNELRGCINDVKAMREVLVQRFGFEPDDIQLLTDEADSPLMPTGSNIRTAIAQMIDRALPGDILFFHYSGHGTLIPSSHSHGCNKHDEAIVPCDFNLITDIDFRWLVNRLPEGASFTIFSDSCHSGGLIDKEKEQIGPHITNLGPRPKHSSGGRPKLIPFQCILDHLSSVSGIQSPNINAHLLQLFGGEASAKFQSLKGLQPSLAADNGILLSGCQTDETSADMDPDGSGSKAYGAFSNAVQLVLKAHPKVITYRGLVTRARELLHSMGFTQHPCLYCSDRNADAPFLWEAAGSTV